MKNARFAAFWVPTLAADESPIAAARPMLKTLSGGRIGGGAAERCARAGGWEERRPSVVPTDDLISVGDRGVNVGRRRCERGGDPRDR